MTSDDTADTTATDVSAEPTAESLRAEVDELRDQLLRRAAEFQNYRRRTEADRAEAERQGRAAVLLPVLDVYDDLRRSLDAARRVAHQDTSSASFDALSQGVELVYRKFEGILEKLGAAPIETSGVPFNVDEHEAVLQQPSPDGEPSGTVLAEVQPGYKLGDRVLRHARVIVAQ
jgi:molecular chaperone GrpE